MNSEAAGPVLDHPWTEAKWGIKEILLVFAVRLLLGGVFSRVLYPFTGGQTQVWVTLIDRLATIFLIIFLVKRLSPDGWSELGLSGRHFPRQVLLGAAVGVVLLVTFSVGEKVMLHLAATGYEEHPLVTSAKGAASGWQFLLPLTAGGLLTPVAEEMLYRGMVFPALARVMGIFLGIVNSALIFTVFHFTSFWFAEIFVTGVVLTVMYWRTGSLVPGMAAHATVNSWRLLAAWLF